MKLKVKSIRLPEDLIKKIQEKADKQDGHFSPEVRRLIRLGIKHDK